MTRTVVVGGGPAGLGAAYRLLNYRGHQVTLLERSPALGGLAAGFRHGDFTLDYGPHRLHSETDWQIMKDLRRMLGEELEWRPRHGRIRLDGKWLPFPVGPRTVLGLGPRRIAEIGLGVLAARLARRSGAPDSYAAALRARLGAPLYRLFYGPYAEKVWGRPGEQIAPGQAERRVNQRGLGDLLRQALGRGAGRSFYYPRGGFGRITEVYGAALEAHPASSVTMPASVEAVVWRDGQVQAVRAAKAGSPVTHELDHLVWTAPLPELVRQLDPPPPPDVLAAAAGLRQRAVVLCYVALAVPRVGDADTYYFPERRFPFNRVTEQKNFSPAMAPLDRTVLCLDLACDPDDALFAASEAELAGRVLPALEEAGLARRDQVTEVFSRRFRNAYPLDDFGHAAAMRRILDWLAGISNLWLAGRQGLLLHNNTHHSLLMGYRAADAIAGKARGDWPDALTEFATYRVAD